MTSTLLDTARGAVEQLRVVNRHLAELPVLPPEELIEAAELIAAVGRLHAGALVATSLALAIRSEGVDAEDSVARQCGVATSADLLSRLTGLRRRSLRQVAHLSQSVLPRPTITGGEAPALFPVVGEALAAGTVSLDQAECIVDSLAAPSVRAHPSDVAAAERSLVHAAVGSENGVVPPLSPELIAVQGRAWRDALDPDGEEPTYDEQRAERSFRLGQRSDGMWVGKLVCTPDQGEALRLVLDAHNAPRTKVRFRDPADIDAALEAAEADRRTSAQRQCDTLIGLIARASEGTDAPRIGGEAPTLVLTIAAADLHRYSEGLSASAHLERHGDAVPARLAAQILCDGFIQTAVTDPSGHVLHLGRRSRLFSPAQRRAVVIRDGGCAVPGCDAPPGFVEIHHVVPWSAGGATDASNAVAICPFHHHELHRERLRIRSGHNSRWRIEPTSRIRSRHSLAA